MGSIKEKSRKEKQMNRIKKWIALCLAGAITAVSSLGSAINTQAAEYWPDNVSVTSGAAIRRRDGDRNCPL